MFTGIVAASCEVVATEQGKEVRSIGVDLSDYDDDLEICLLYTSPSPRD